MMEIDLQTLPGLYRSMNCCTRMLVVSALVRHKSHLISYAISGLCQPLLNTSDVCITFTSDLERGGRDKHYTVDRSSPYQSSGCWHGLLFVKMLTLAPLAHR